MGKNFNPRPQCAGCGEFLPSLPTTGEPPWLCSTECAALLTHNLIEEERALNKATELFGTNMKHKRPARPTPKVSKKQPAAVGQAELEARFLQRAGDPNPWAVNFDFQAVPAPGWHGRALDVAPAPVEDDEEFEG